MQRTEDEIFNMVVTDAVARTYNIRGVRANRPMTMAALRAKMKKAGFFEPDPEMDLDANAESARG